MNIHTNHSLSVDCVIFGFDSEGLKVLLINQRRLEWRESSSPGPGTTGATGMVGTATGRGTVTADEDPRLKLPGRMIYENETLEDAANSILLRYTGLENAYLKQVAIFSDPHRVSADELKWICEYHNISTNRVVTVGYYSLVHISTRIHRHTAVKGAKWRLVSSVRDLAMDHLEILHQALNVMRRDFTYSPIAFRLLPNKFTLRQLQDLYSVILGVEYDNRNFRKKILASEIVRPTGEKQKGVSHKPAEFYTFRLALRALIVCVLCGYSAKLGCFILDLAEYRCYNPPECVHFALIWRNIDSIFGQTEGVSYLYGGI